MEGWGRELKDAKGERKKRLLSQISSFEMRPMTEHFCRRTGRPAPYFMTSATSNACVCVLPMPKIKGAAKLPPINVPP